MKKSIAVIMTVHNRRDITVECIRRFYTCSGLENYDVDFFLMDDGSTDGTSDAVKKEFPQVIILYGDGNLFWNRGMYHCWVYASKKYHDYYLWLNDDTKLHEDAIVRLVETASKYDSKSIIVGSTQSQSCEGELTYGGVDKNNNRLEAIDKEQECYTFNGNIVLIPNAVFEKVGLNNPTYHHGAGDYDYGIRALRKGFKNIVAKGFYGYCERHDVVQKWQDPKVPLNKRMRFLFSLNGQTNPGDVFKYNIRYKGVGYAIKYYLICLIRVMFPKFFIVK